MTKFNVGDKVVLVTAPLGFIYEISYITKDGYYVCESDIIRSTVYSEGVLKLYKPPTFSYFHPTCGLHEWEVVTCINTTDNVCIKSTSDPNIWFYAPVALVEHYLEDKYVR